MDIQTLESALRSVLYVSAVIGLGFLLIRFFWLEWVTWKNSKAAVESCGAVAFYKDPQVRYLPQGQAGSSVYHITFHTDAGDIVTLYMGYQDYYIIEEGTYGQLVWQGTKFWKFTQT